MEQNQEDSFREVEIEIYSQHTGGLEVRKARILDVDSCFIKLMIGKEIKCVPIAKVGEITLTRLP